MTYLFNELGINRVEGMHDVRNPNSGKVMKKCGMQYEGIHRSYLSSNSGIGDALSYAILAKDFM